MLHRSLIAAAALVLTAATAPQAQTNTLSLGVTEMRQLAADSIAAGNVEQARTLAEGLLLRDPNDIVGLTILAQTAYQMADWPAARQAAARIFRSSDDPRRRYEAARLAALTAANEERYTLAELWLRRALIVAPTDADSAQTTQDAAGLRSLNPWTTNVRLSFAPSANLNGGATDAAILVDGQPLIDPFFGLQAGVNVEDRAVSGWAYVLEPSVSYRLPSSNENQRTTLSLHAYGRGVLLSQESKDFIEGAFTSDGDPLDASSYSSALVDVSIRHDRVIAQGALTLQLTGGRTWARTDQNYDFLRFTANKTEQISPRNLLIFSATAERRDDADRDISDSDRLILSAGWQHQLSNRDVLSFGLNGTKVDSDSATLRSTGWGLSATYRPAQTIGPASVLASVAVGWQDYPDYGIGFSAIPREDQFIRGTLQLSFDDLSYAGFIPVLTATGERKISNINQFEGDAFGVEFGLRSTF